MLRWDCCWKEGNSAADAVVAVRLLLERGNFCSYYSCCSETAVGKREFLLLLLLLQWDCCWKEGNAVAAAAVAVRLLLERGKFFSCYGCGETAVGMGLELTLLSLLLLLPLGNTFFYYYYMCRKGQLCRWKENSFMSLFYRSFKFDWSNENI